MSELNIGKEAVNFCLKDIDGKNVCLKDFVGKKIILYFYPRDNTPGCTAEAVEFSELKNEFEKNGTIIIGISRDSCESHKRFMEKHGINIILLCDEDGKVHKAYNVLGKKKFMGREYVGTIRSTFLIDEHGKIMKIWKNVRARGHAKSVLDFLKNENLNILTTIE